MTTTTRRRVFAIIRIVVCVAALWIVVRGVTINDHVVLRGDKPDLVGRVHSADDPVVMTLRDGERVSVPHAEIAEEADGALAVRYGIRSAWRDSQKSLLLLALLIHAPVGVLQGVRLLVLLRAQQIKLSLWNCIKLSYAGNFLNFATPLGSNAGDVFKAYFVSLHTERKTEAVTTIILDRAIGLFTLLLAVGLISLTAPAVERMQRLEEFRPWVLTFIGLGAAAVLLYLAPPVRKLLRWRKWVERIPASDQVLRVDAAARSLLTKPMILILAGLLTLALQILAIGAYFAVAVGMGMDAHTGNVLEYYAYFYIGAIVQALPGPPQGLGTVELTYRYFLAPYGGASRIVSMALIIRLVVLIVALPGLLIALTGSYKPGIEKALHGGDDGVAPVPVDRAQARAGNPAPSTVR